MHLSVKLIYHLYLVSKNFVILTIYMNLFKLKT